MNRKTIFFSVLALLVLLSGGLGYLTFGKIQHRRQVETTLQTLPNIQGWSMDSAFVQYQPASNRPTVVIYFNSECHICQYEAQEIRDNEAALQNADLLMLSSENLSAIQAFVRQYQLDKRANIQAMQLDPVAITQTFGAVSVPSIFIYDTHRQLVKHYRGETKLDAILRHL